MNTQERIQMLLNYSGLNPKQFAEKINAKTKQAIYELQKGNTKSISQNMASKILSCFPEVNKIWLLTGEGEMLLSPFDLSIKTERKKLGLSQVQLAKKIGVDTKTIQNWESGRYPIPATKYGILRDALCPDTQSEQEVVNEISTVPLYPVSAQGGTLSEFSTTVCAGQDFERIASPVKHAEFAITVNGDSMRPEYPSGAVIFISKVNEKAFIDWGKTYVLDTVNGTVIKKLMPADTEDRVRCVSNNTDFPPYDIEWQYVIAVYRVLACLIMK